MDLEIVAHFYAHRILNNLLRNMLYAPRRSLMGLEIVAHYYAHRILNNLLRNMLYATRRSLMGLEIVAHFYAHRMIILAILRLHVKGALGSTH